MSSLSWFEEDAGSAHHLLNHSLLHPHQPLTARLSLAVASIIVVLVVVYNGRVGVPRRSCDRLVSSSSYVVFRDAAETDIIHAPPAPPDTWDIGAMQHQQQGTHLVPLATC